MLTSRPPPHESGALPLSYRAMIRGKDFNLKDFGKTLLKTKDFSCFKFLRNVAFKKFDL